MSTYRRFKDCEKQLEETKGKAPILSLSFAIMRGLNLRGFFSCNIAALAKEDGNDEDMAEMIALEIDSLSAKLKELEENIKVFSLNFSSYLALL